MEILLSLLRSLYPDLDVEAVTDFIDGEILDSFSIVSLIASIDDEFGVTIPAEEMLPENFNSAAALYSLIQRLQYDEI